MVSKWVYAGLLIVVFIYCVQPYAVEQTTMNDEDVMNKLTITLHEFQKAHGMTDAQLERLVGRLILNSESFRKGGLGKIDEKETYAVLDEPRNSLLIAGHKWEGRDAGTNEVVIADDKHVLVAVDGENSSNLRIVLFSPKEVRYINLDNNSGGRYVRYLKTDK